MARTIQVRPIFVATQLFRSLPFCQVHSPRRSRVLPSRIKCGRTVETRARLWQLRATQTPTCWHGGNRDTEFKDLTNAFYSRDLPLTTVSPPFITVEF